MTKAIRDFTAAYNENAAPFLRRGVLPRGSDCYAHWRVLPSANREGPSCGPKELVWRYFGYRAPTRVRALSKNVQIFSGDVDVAIE